ncbi:tetratricopeptide (TPR) repeat protein [Catenulispora sp. GAS73]|uniref:ATP-binding protein n=1 Tax=Catenulispora sp. GAS73 TaxID=3156269 RepID=UPI0035120F13
MGGDHGTQSEISGSAGNAVQARDISGDIHFHSASQAPTPTPRQLPGDVRGFVNRVADLRALDEALLPAPEGGTSDTDGRDSGLIVVISGTAGVGKSSLAVHWAHKNRSQFPDGQLHANLHGFDQGPPVNPADVLGRFIEALGVPATMTPADHDARAALFRSLVADKHLLIVLDNAASSEQVRPLLPGASHCATLITSRSRLSALAVRDGAVRITADIFAEPDAVKLLTTTFGTARTDEATDIAELAGLCARLPLALRIAAERAASRPMMPLTDLIAELRSESSMWDALSSEDAAEADAVRTVFAWSYRALSEPASRMFRLLGLHPTSEFSVGAAAALAGVPPRTASRLLDDLSGAHLITQLERDRFQVHDLLHAYAADQADETDTDETNSKAVSRLLDWYVQGTEAVRAAAPYEQASHHVPIDGADPDVTSPSFPDYPAALSWFRSERGNLVAASHLAERLGFDRHAWQIPAALSFAYAHNGYFDDWLAITPPGLAAAERDGSRAGQAALLASLGMAYRQSGRFEEAAGYYDAALAIHRETEDQLGQAWVLDLIGFLDHDAGRLDSAMTAFTTSVNICLAEQLDGFLGYPTEGIGCVRLAHGDTDGAVTAYQESLALHTAAGDAIGCFHVLVSICDAQLVNGLAAEAERTSALALEAAETLDSRAREGQALIARARALQSVERADEALACYQRAAMIQRTLGDRVNEARAIAGAAEAYRILGRDDEAEDFERWAGSLRAALEVPGTTLSNPAVLS